MKRNEFAEIFKDFAYGFTEPRLLDEGSVTTWYKYLRDFSEEDFRKTVDTFIMCENKRPSLSELIEKCESIQRRRERETEWQ